MMKYIYLLENGKSEDLSVPSANSGSVEHLAFLDVKAFKKLRKKIKAELKNDNQKVAIIYSTPAAIIASGLRNQIEPERLVTQWIQQAEALVNLFKSYSSNCILANLNALKADIDGLTKQVSMNKKERATFEMLSKSANADIYTLSAHYLINHNDELKRQLLMLDACTAFNEYSEDICDIQTILNQQSEKEKQLEAELSKSQLALEQQQEKVVMLQQGAETLSNQVAQEKILINETKAKHALEIEQLQNNLENQLKNIKSLNTEKDALDKTLKSTQADLANQTEENEEIIKQLHLVQEAFEESILSTNKLKSDISALEKQLERSENQQTWLVKELLASHEVNAKSWSYRSLMKKKIKAIKESGLFDEAWYLETYPEVAASKTNPILHYLLYGAVEGKNPSPEFNTKNYLSIYFDVAQHGMNPFIHYINFGKKEGRKADPLQKRLPSPKAG